MPAEPTDEKRNAELKAAQDILNWASDPAATMPTQEEKQWALDVITGPDHK